jgi:hypothetical protein
LQVAPPVASAHTFVVALHRYPARSSQSSMSEQAPVFAGVWQTPFRQDSDRRQGVAAGLHASPAVTGLAQIPVVVPLIAHTSVAWQSES